MGAVRRFRDVSRREDGQIQRRSRLGRHNAVFHPTSPRHAQSTLQTAVFRPVRAGRKLLGVQLSRWKRLRFVPNDEFHDE